MSTRGRNTRQSASQRTRPGAYRGVSALLARVVCVQSTHGKKSRPDPEPPGDVSIDDALQCSHAVMTTSSTESMAWLMASLMSFGPAMPQAPGGDRCDDPAGSLTLEQDSLRSRFARIAPVLGVTCASFFATTESVDASRESQPLCYGVAGCLVCREALKAVRTSVDCNN